MAITIRDIVDAVEEWIRMDIRKDTDRCLFWEIYCKKVRNQSRSFCIQIL